MSIKIVAVRRDAVEILDVELKKFGFNPNLL
jgi:hypothetical protein